MTRNEELELEVIEYVLGLDALGVGVGGEAGRIQEEAIYKIKRLLLWQKQALEIAILVTQAKAAKSDAQAHKFERDIETVWLECLERLKVLYLVSGSAPIMEIA